MDILFFISKRIIMEPWVVILIKNSATKVMENLIESSKNTYGVDA